MTYRVGDDVAVPLLVIDDNDPPAPLNFPVTVNARHIDGVTTTVIDDADWSGPQDGAQRVVAVPIASLPKPGVWGFDLVIDDAQDLFLDCIYLE